MTRKSVYQLLPQAKALLRKLGYIETKYLDKNFGCYKHCKEASEQLFLIQTRSYNSESFRYMVGLILEKMIKCDCVIVFFEKETKILKIPGTFLQNIYNNNLDTASYSHGMHQWRVDFYLTEESMSPQGSNGRRYSITDHVIKLDKHILESMS